jgi:predicted aldo/keto reductase-like oxidoreductase
LIDLSSILSANGGHMDFTVPRLLGRTGLLAGRLGVASGYGAPAEAFEAAFERGCNYFYWGSRRTQAMNQAIRNIAAKGQRDRLIIVLQSYSRSAALMESFLISGLKKGGLDHADVLLLGWHNKPPSRRILDKARSLKERGLVRFLAVSSHKRKLFPRLAEQGGFDIFHIRYNAANRGAETECFPHLTGEDRPGIVTYTATRWGGLLKAKNMPPGEHPLKAGDCYRFVLSNPAVDVCMTGPKTLDHMKEALMTLDLGPLSAEKMARVRRIGDHVHAHARKFF